MTGMATTIEWALTPTGEPAIEADERFDARLRHLEEMEQTQRRRARDHRRALDLEVALAAGEVTVHYQPIVSLPSGRIVAVEALARWNHPKRGLVPPDEFIPIAEQTGLIVDLGTQVLNEACRQVREWQRSVPALRFLRVAVNVSAHQLTPDLPEVVAGALTRSGLAGECLELELTESVAMADVNGTLEILDRVAALGVSFTIDDFGTGYSSLAYLKRLPVTGLKIDKSFIDDLSGDRRDVSIVGAIIAMATELGLTQIAEGVETDAQRAQLEALGCAHAQGYLFSRPRPGATFVGDTADLITGRLGEPAGADRSPVRVVVCDDEPSIRKLYRRALRSRDVEVTEAASAHQCLSQVTATRPHLVIIDAMMPAGFGLDIVAEVRARQPDARIVVVSGAVTRDMLERSQAAGADACLQKMQFLPRLADLVDTCRI